jgi:D-aminoacyl-tRNA deacylase
MVRPEAFRHLAGAVLLELLQGGQERDGDHCTAAYPRGPHKVCARPGGKAHEGGDLPGPMRFLVASEADEASRTQREELLGTTSWTSEREFAGRPTWRHGDLALVTVPEHHLYRDHLDRDLEVAFGAPVDLVVYLSKHRSESGRPSLTVHPIGNPGAAEFGGQPETLVPAAPQWMTAALRALRQEARDLPFEVTFEATHHGPYLEASTFYIEQGSTEREWSDPKAAHAIARVLLSLAPLDAPIAIGIGGGHYMPRHTSVALTRRIAFGHLLPSHVLDASTLDRIDRAVDRTPGAQIAYLHRKSLSTPLLHAIERRLESLGIRVVREADLDASAKDETS